MVMIGMCDLMVSMKNNPLHYSRGGLGTTNDDTRSVVACMRHKSAKEIMLLCTKAPFRRGYDAGFVNRVVPNGEHESHAQMIAKQRLNLEAALSGN
jgi:1,4-dihydroxy-2-naphthoyl-CoA synthase